MPDNHTTTKKLRARHRRDQLKELLDPQNASGGDSGEGDPTGDKPGEASSEVVRGVALPPRDITGAVDPGQEQVGSSDKPLQRNSSYSSDTVSVQETSPEFVPPGAPLGINAAQVAAAAGAMKSLREVLSATSAAGGPGEQGAGNTRPEDERPHERPEAITAAPDSVVALDVVPADRAHPAAGTGDHLNTRAAERVVVRPEEPIAATTQHQETRVVERTSAPSVTNPRESLVGGDPGNRNGNRDQLSSHLPTKKIDLNQGVKKVTHGHTASSFPEPPDAGHNPNAAQPVNSWAHQPPLKVGHKPPLGTSNYEKTDMMSPAQSSHPGDALSEAHTRGNHQHDRHQDLVPAR